MEAEDVYKALAELSEKKKGEFHMTNAELAEKLYGVINDGTHDYSEECKVLIFKCGGCCDDISFEGEHFRMDCMHPSGIIRVWNRRGFTITEDLSSISFVENENRED